MIDLFKGELLRFRLWALVAGLINLAILGFLSRMVDLAQQPLQVYQVFGVVYAVAGALLEQTHAGSSLDRHHPLSGRGKPWLRPLVRRRVKDGWP